MEGTGPTGNIPANTGSGAQIIADLNVGNDSWHRFENMSIGTAKVGSFATLDVNGNFYSDTVNAREKLKVNRIEPLINKTGENLPQRETIYSNIKLNANLISSHSNYDGTEIFNSFSNINNLLTTSDNIIGFHDRTKSYFLDDTVNPEYLDNVYFSFTNYSKNLDGMVENYSSDIKWYENV